MPSKEAPPAGPSSIPFAEQWLGPWKLATAMTLQGLASFARLYDTRQLLARWSPNMTEVVDRYLRSPDFLELMASTLKTMATVTRWSAPLRFK
jgi:hypothetical protein